MTHNELVRALATRERLSIRHCSETLRALSEIVVVELAAGRPVVLGDVGTLSPSSSGVRFRPAKSLRSRRRGEGEVPGRNVTGALSKTER